MEWRIKLEAKTGRGEVSEVEIANVSRRVVSATDEDVGLSLTEICSRSLLHCSIQDAVGVELPPKRCLD